MSKSIFLSYVYEDIQWRNKVVSWAQSGLLGPGVVTTMEQEDLRHLGEAAVERHLEPKIRGAAAVVCLVGQDTHNHEWVQRELEVATSLNKRIVLLRIPGTIGPAPARHRHLSAQVFDPSTLKQVI